MAKKKIQSAFFCQSCGTQSPKWLGKCPQCNEWNTFVEELLVKESESTGGYKSNKINTPNLVSEIDYSNEKRIVTKDKELNRVLGGGIVPGSCALGGSVARRLCDSAARPALRLSGPVADALDVDLRRFARSRHQAKPGLASDRG